MATVHVWTATRRFTSFEEMRAFIDPTFTEDGDLIPSAFMREVELDGDTPACIEAIHQAEPAPLADLLAGASYAEQWVHLLDGSVLASEAVCVFEPNTVGRPIGASLRYLGAFPYRVD